MKMRFYYLHVWSVLDLDGKVTTFKDRSVHPPIIDKVGLKLDFWPADGLFTIWPLFFVDERLRSCITYRNLTGVSFEKVTQIKQGLNFAELYKDSILPPFYWRMNINGQPLVDDFALWNKTYLVVSEKNLTFLRDNHVIHAEADEIDVPLKEYFTSNRKDFWKFL